MAEKKEKPAKAAQKAAPKAAGKPKAKAPKAREKKAEAQPATDDTQTLVPRTDRYVVDVLDADNQKISQIKLHPDVFGVRVNDHLLYEAVKQYRAGGRRGSSYLCGHIQIP